MLRILNGGAALALSLALSWPHVASAQTSPTPRLTPRLTPRPSSPPANTQPPPAQNTPPGRSSPPKQSAAPEKPAPEKPGAPPAATPGVSPPAAVGPVTPEGQSLAPGFYPPLLPAYRNMDPPPGYVVRRRFNVPLLVGGGFTFALTYSASLIYAANTPGMGGLAVPIVGPWIAIGGQKFDCQITVTDPNNVDQSTNEATQCVADGAKNVAILAGMGVGQLVGSVLFTVGLVDQKKRWLRADLAGLGVEFAPHPTFPGLVAHGTF